MFRIVYLTYAYYFLKKYQRICLCESNLNSNSQGFLQERDFIFVYLLRGIRFLESFSDATAQRLWHPTLGVNKFRRKETFIHLLKVRPSGCCISFYSVSSQPEQEADNFVAST